MRWMILGMLLTTLGFLVYPQLEANKCQFYEGFSSCGGSTSTMKAVAAKNVAEQIAEKEIKPPQQIHKWVDANGVVHYGEKAVSNSERIDQQLDEITVIENAADITAVNKKASGSLSSSYTYPSYSSGSVNGSTQVNQLKRKREKCAKLAAKRNRYEMGSSSYKYYGTRYREECMFN
ncbi:MAG: DUF4124 domain-containing protein [Pseudomonadales bacterium]|nr:DUF4124 domain-containing protein [Pseudomonadales bacterium]